jgi:hypothetical protein
MVTTRICMQLLKWLSVYFHGADEMAKCLFACNQLSQLHMHSRRLTLFPFGRGQGA